MTFSIPLPTPIPPTITNHLWEANQTAQIEEIFDEPPCQHRELAVPEMLEKLEALTPAGDTLSTKLKEHPLFMFSSVAGRTRDHQIFYDTGNSHCLYRTGTPADLWGCVMWKGPHSMGVVGGIKLQGGDSWACQPKTTSGK